MPSDSNTRVPPNAHYIFPAGWAAEQFSIVLCGNERVRTGQGKILQALKSATSRRVYAGQPRVSITDVAPSWYLDPAVLKFHVQYTHGFAFLLDGSSQAALDVVKDMYNAISRTASALGICHRDKGRDVPMPVVLIVINDDTAREIGTITTSVVLAEAAKLAAHWGSEIFVSDARTSGNQEALAARVYLSLLQRMQEARNSSNLTRPSFVPGKANPPQRFLLRRITARVLPDSILKLFK